MNSPRAYDFSKLGELVRWARDAERGLLRAASADLLHKAGAVSALAEGDFAQARIAALEAFAAAFADAEWVAKGRRWRVCDECDGIEPDPDNEIVGGHRPDCARGLAVAKLKETA